MVFKLPAQRLPSRKKFWLSGHFELNKPLPISYGMVHDSMQKESCHASIPTQPSRLTGVFGRDQELPLAIYRTFHRPPFHRPHHTLEPVDLSLVHLLDYESLDCFTFGVSFR